MARAVKLDEQLAAATEEARAALLPLVPEGSLGDHLSVSADADRLVTHRFASSVTGYRGWEWYVTLGRASRSKIVTVCESGLLPGPDALLAPDWVPWADRMSAAELASAQGETAPEGDEDESAELSVDAAAQAGGTGEDTPEEAEQPAEAEESDDVSDDEEAAGESAPSGAPRRRRRRRR